MTNNKMPVTRIIFDNYDLYEQFPDEDLKQIAIECGWVDDENDITNEDLEKWRYEESENNWECEKEMLEDFFAGKKVIFLGKVGLWNGVYKAGKIGEFWKLFDDAITDCDYIKLYDENGHFYLTCSHHDGTNHFEIKVITKKGSDYLERWENNWNDKRSEGYCHTQIFNKYSKIPEFAHKVYGCKRREYEPITKGKLIDKLNNGARSNYTA